MTWRYNFLADEELTTLTDYTKSYGTGEKASIINVYKICESLKSHYIVFRIMNILVSSLFITSAESLRNGDHG